MFTAVKKTMCIGVVAMLCMVSVPSSVLAVVFCPIKPSELSAVVYYRANGYLYVSTTKGAHHICSTKVDGDRCRDLQALSMGAFLGGRGLTLRYEKSAYNCSKNWGGFSAHSQSVQYLYLNKQ